MRRAARLDVLAASLGAAVALWGCADAVCAGEDGACVVATPCRGLSFACAGGSAHVEVATSSTDLPEGASALGSPGDFVLRNDRVVAVIDAIDHPHYLGPSGGTLLDLATVTGRLDNIEQVSQATGLLPGDAALYVEARTFEGDGFAAVQVRGHMAGHPDQPIVTRYEVRACEPGIRIRTEAVNLEPDPAVWTLTDGWYWGGRTNEPFVPYAGVGFDYPHVELDALTDSFRSIPFLGTLPPAGTPVGYASIACGPGSLDGFFAVDVCSAGRAPRIVPFREAEVFERFVAVADGEGVSAASDVALGVRHQLYGDAIATLRGRVELGTLGSGARTVQIHVARGHAADPPSARTPETQIAPAADGTFSAQVRSGFDYVVDVEVLGRVVATRELRVDPAGADAGTIGLTPAGTLVLSATVDGVRDHALVFLEPADEATRSAVDATRGGDSTHCAPLLGAPHGPSPACNRVLVDGDTTVDVLPGRYDVYATAGPFATLAYAGVVVEPAATVRAPLAIVRLPLQPAGTLSADFHVHGAASFDSTIPDFDRVRAFLAANVQVVAATDHDVVHDYADALSALDAESRLHVITGVETTGHILFDLVPGAEFPQVIGHWNFWPVPFDPDGPWRGAPWEELAEPGLLFTRVEAAGWRSSDGVIQLNHPWDPSDFGRDLGFARAIGIDATRPLPATFDGTGQGLFRRTPAGAAYANSDYHTQEVMNGSGNGRHLPYRAFWFYLLDQGLVRAGTANSDSHGLTDSVLGSPRTLVWSDVTLGAFDVMRFDRAVRDGRMSGTNGPVIEVSTTDAAGATRTPSVEAFVPAASAVLHVRVRAAPWVPVDEVRIVVNGVVVRTLRDELGVPADAFGVDGLDRFEGDLALAELVPETAGDAWLVVEAGRALVPNADVDCDGIPDTGDNDGDGDIDAADVGVTPGPDTPLPAVSVSTGRCGGDVGPLRLAPVPRERDAPGHAFGVVVPGGSPTAFTNPLLFDLDGGGYTGALR